MAEVHPLTAMVERLNLAPEWQNALNQLQGIERAGLGWRYTGVHDVKPLAAMLNSGEPVPPLVAKTIAVHLDPPKERWTGRLRHEPPPQRAIKFFSNKRKEEEALAYYKSKLEENGWKRACFMTAEKFEVKESWVKNLTGRDIEEEVFSEASQCLDPSTWKP